MGAYFITATIWRRIGSSVTQAAAGPPDAGVPGTESSVIDEVGYLPAGRSGRHDFLPAVSARYERGSIILTSNKSYGDWGSIFGDSIIATAILTGCCTIRRPLTFGVRAATG